MLTTYYGTRLEVIFGVLRIERVFVENLWRDVLKHDALEDIAVVIEGFGGAKVRPSQVESEHFFFSVELRLARWRFVSECNHARAVNGFHLDVICARHARFGEFLAFRQELLRDEFGAQIADGMTRLRSRERPVKRGPKRHHVKKAAEMAEHFVGARGFIVENFLA